MTQAERCLYISTLVTASTRQPWKNCYDQLIQIHSDYFDAGIHGGPSSFFLPWHRWYLLSIENLLRKINCNVTVPYWDWSLESQIWTNSIVWNAQCGIGGDGIPVRTGPFRSSVWTTPNGRPLARRFNRVLPDCASVAMGQRMGIPQFTSWHRFVSSNLHNTFHCNMGGVMCTSEAANDPVFFFHHGFLDKLDYVIQDELQFQLGIVGEHTIVDWKNFCRDICLEYFIRNPVVIGGPGQTVEIDECLLVRRKYNVGHQWGGKLHKCRIEFKNLARYSQNTEEMPGTFGTTAKMVYDLLNLPGCVQVCFQQSDRPCCSNTTYSPLCYRDMSSRDISPLKLARLVHRPFPRVSDEAFNLFHTTYEDQVLSNRFSDLMNAPDKLIEVLGSSGYSTQLASVYQPTTGT
eukprot:Em0002g1808a